MSRARSLATTEKSLRRRFRVVATDVRLAGRTLAILHPENAEDLIDERAFERDERLPYWAELWPSSQVLGERLLRLAGAGRSLVELGCGAGLVTTCAALAGFDVVASDYYEDALRFARVNAWRHDAPAPKSLLLDWRSLPRKLPRFDVVVASDVLYEREYGGLVARAIDALLAPHGAAFVSDPGRVGRDAFLRSLRQLGIEVACRSHVPFRDGPVRQTITVFELVRG